MSTLVTDPTGRPDAPAEPQVRDRADVRRQVKLVVVLALLVAVEIWFKLEITDPEVSHLLKGPRSAENQPVFFDGSYVSWGAVAITAVALLLAVLNRYPRGAGGVLLAVLVGASFYGSFLMWAYADSALPIAITNPLGGTLLVATYLVLGALAGVVCERAGVVNIAIEGQFIMAAFFASVFCSLAVASLGGLPLFWTPVVGMVGGALAGVLVAALLGFFALRYQVDQVVVGVVLVTFGYGLTSFLRGQIPGDQAARLNRPYQLENVEIPGLADIPYIGQAMFNQTLLVYLMYLAIPGVWFLLFQTRWGLRVRSVGEHPKAADTVGIDVIRVRWQALLLGGVLAGLGGSAFTLSTGAFTSQMSAGLGFIALAAVIMGRWHPIYAALAAIAFAFLRNLRDQLSILDEKVPGELISMLPYLATIIAVAGLVGRVRAPAASGQHYSKGD
ncbi:ABC transporter permease [Nocardioides zeae]|uniref:ABC transporter permease n=1 Tax=Nocardioides imazamoxiresistens TaxID=3231893 RepID=A0ABU3PU80_9ACTN|nr:ABC transporter permease [Nocardioides zeae]MDT9592751.1 ABC transporter permease [Nocardioides zeae]